ncbi:hypothetical protein [Bacillus sp. REN3]|uniref:hypothetical protein n=1 Tax=Bacillus sp. REN3 TaxID=2802440 RepID=UPI001AEDEA16|nr:hypothetical protein [Bacillus sp. REN3]
MRQAKDQCQQRIKELLALFLPSSQLCLVISTAAMVGKREKMIIKALFYDQKANPWSIILQSCFLYYTMVAGGLFPSLDSWSKTENTIAIIFY